MFKLPVSFAEWGSAAMVFVVSMLAGRFASEGMNLLQWAGAAAAVLGSVTLAVGVRVWPAEARPRNDKPR